MDTLFDHMLVEVNRLLEYPEWLPTERSQISFYTKKLSHFSKIFQIFTITEEDCLSELVTDPTLNVLVTRILKNKNVSSSADFLVNDPPELAHVGNRLAFEVALMHKATNQGFNSILFWNSYLEYFVESFNFDDPLDHYHFLFGDLLDESWDQPGVSWGECLSSADPLGEDEYFSEDFPCEFYLDKSKFLEQEDEEDEAFVGFQVEADKLLQQLASITKKQLRVISIVGMAGLGKTTLAARLYNHPYVVSYFYVPSWITLTQNYQKRDLLLAILRSVVEINDEVCRLTDNMLAHALYHALKGRRYLIVIDDVWSSEAWDDFKSCFPDDNNGSKIMLTPRLKDVALHAQSDGSPLCLRFLTEEESFDMFKIKTFRDGQMFGKLSLIGKSITKKCRGLPLAIVVIAGLLKNNFEVDWWASVEEGVGSYIITDKNQYMDTLALSYNHLPQHLRPCFLSFGAFPGGHDIPVRKLLWLWVAEGKKGSNGAMKTCRIHVLLRDLCLRKAEEENFSTDTYQHNKHSYSCSHSLTNPSTKSQLLLSTSSLAVPSICSCYSLRMYQLYGILPILLGLWIYPPKKCFGCYCLVFKSIPRSV